MQEIIILVGISGSGKTTWCEDFIKENPGYVRVNRDSVRMEITASNSRFLERDLENLVNKLGCGIWQCETYDLSAYYVADGGYDINGNYQEPLFRTPPRVYGKDKDGKIVNGIHIW